jgi:hypothetical protein
MVAFAFGLAGNCDPETVDAPASQLEVRATVLDVEDAPSDGKVPVLVQFFKDGKFVKLAGTHRVTTNGVVLSYNGIAYAERVPMVATGGTYTVVHERGGVPTQVAITVPPRPIVTSPTAGQTVQRSNNLTIGYVGGNGTGVRPSASDGSTGISAASQPDTGTATIDVSALRAGPGTVGLVRDIVASPGGTGFAAARTTYTIGSLDTNVTWQ